MREKLRGNEYRTTVVCVDTYENRTPVGRLYNPSCEGETFESLVEFLFKTDDLLNEMRFPQSFTAARTFSPALTRNAEAPPGDERQKGKLATFALRILFRQNASWQGSVSWLEGGKEQSFRSVLELIFLMDSALTGS